MDRSKSIISIVVGLAAVLIVWRVGFYPPVPEQVEKSTETKVAADTDKPGEAKKPADANEPGEAVIAKEDDKPKDPNAPDEAVAKGDKKKAEDPNDPIIRGPFGTVTRIGFNATTRLLVLVMRAPIGKAPSTC